MNLENILSGSNSPSNGILNSLTDGLQELKYVGLAITTIFVIGWIVGLISNLMVKRSILKIARTVDEINHKLDNINIINKTGTEALTRYEKG